MILPVTQRGQQGPDGDGLEPGEQKVHHQIWGNSLPSGCGERSVGGSMEEAAWSLEGDEGLVLAHDGSPYLLP